MAQHSRDKPSEEREYCVSMTQESLKMLPKWMKEDMVRTPGPTAVGLHHNPLFDEAVMEIYYKWQPIATAPKKGEIIEISYGDGTNKKENCLAFWSDNPICILGRRNGSFLPGWATAGPNVDYNLPLDSPKIWRRIKSEQKELNTKS